MIEKKIIFQSSKDEGTDSYYIYLKESLKDSKVGESVKQIVIDNESLKGELIIDLDAQGKVIGIEILGDIVPDKLKVR